MSEKSGFIYIWRDRKHRRYYIGAHWGSEDDGYVCSSSWMKQAYKQRPKDFRRKILSRNLESRKEMLAEEYRWLSLIKEHEIGKKCYNVSVHHFSHWSSDDFKRNFIRNKISKSLKGKPSKSSGKFCIGNAKGLQTRFTTGQKPHNFGKSLEETYGERAPEIRDRLRKSKAGKSFKNSGQFGSRPPWNKGLAKLFITDGISNRCLYNTTCIPDGWKRGMTKKNRKISESNP
jgi:hypothetical protein